jgi:MarR-like DNA-binding transcriptional regulator SgrR of sgrS sRNA
VFTSRPNVILHSGAPWEPGVLSAPDDRPIEEILRRLSHPRHAIAVRTPEGQLVGTGPFRVAAWEPGRSATLAAHDRYWGARPYLDAIEVKMGRPLRDQALDFDLGAADLTEIAVTDVRRLRQRGIAVALSRPVETLALVFDRKQPPPAGVREAVALSIDRAAIYNVILQRQGEVSGALLPQWLSGYAFLFAPARDLGKAKQLAANAQPLAFGYDRQDATLRAVAERIAVNASEVGIVLRAGEPAGVRLIRTRVAAPDVTLALRDLAAALGGSEVVNGGYEAERALLEESHVVPLFHLPACYQVNGRVRDWPAPASDRWRMEDVWLAEAP